MIAQLVLHLAEEYAPSIHVRLSEKTRGGISNSSVRAETQSVTHYFSPPLDLPMFMKRKTATPSIILAAEFPRNLLRGLSAPSILIPCSGAM